MEPRRPRPGCRNARRPALVGLFAGDALRRLLLARDIRQNVVPAEPAAGCDYVVAVTRPPGRLGRRPHHRAAHPHQSWATRPHVREPRQREPLQSPSGPAPSAANPTRVYIYPANQWHTAKCDPATLEQARRRPTSKRRSQPIGRCTTACNDLVVPARVPESAWNVRPTTVFPRWRGRRPRFMATRSRREGSPASATTSNYRSLRPTAPRRSPTCTCGKPIRVFLRALRRRRPT